METKLFILLFFACLSTAFGQDKYATLLKIKALYEKESLQDNSDCVSYNSETKQLTLSDYVINMTENTLFDYRKEKESGETQHQVQFFCQKGTTVIDKTDLSKKRAWLGLTLKSKEACYELISLLNKLKT